MLRGAARAAARRMKLPDFFEQDRALIEEALGRLLPEEHVAPATIHRAMRYCVLGGGKRLRPILCLEAARLFNDDATAGIAIGCALEFIHGDSLNRTGLPARDNVDLRPARA